MNNVITLSALFVLSFCLIGCKQAPKSIKAPKEMTSQKSLDTLDTREVSLIFFAADTAYLTNARLLRLLDTLYIHVKNDNFPAKVKEEEIWMKNYRQRLVAYYDSVHGRRSLSAFVKADSVLNEGARLVMLGTNMTTMGTILHNDSRLAFNRCRQYGLLTQLIDCCRTDEEKTLVYKEWALHDQILKRMEKIAGNVARLQYWGGIITGPLWTSALFKLSQARIEMYQTLLNIKRGKERNTTGDLANAEQLLFDSCNASIDLIKKNSNRILEYEKPESHKEFYKCIKETEVAIKELKPLMDEWIMLLDQLDYSFTTDDSRHSVERAASNMLTMWSSIVTVREKHDLV